MRQMGHRDGWKSKNDAMPFAGSWRDVFSLSQRDAEGGACINSLSHHRKSLKRKELDTAASHGYIKRLNYAPVAQLDRVPGYELGGREFESLRARQLPDRS